jgi:hypothetical protein
MADVEESASKRTHLSRRLRGSRGRTGWPPGLLIAGVTAALSVSGCDSSGKSSPSKKATD